MKYLFAMFIMLGLLGCQREDLNDNEEDPDPINGGLIAYFPLDSSFADASGNDHLLLAYGEPEFKEGYDSGPGSGVLLDGYDDYLVGTIGKLDTFSISMWLLSYRYFVGEWPHWRSTLFDYSDKQVYGYIDGVSGATKISLGIESEPVTGIVPDNIYEWSHLYIAVGNDIKIYINGTLSKTESLQESVPYLSELIYLGRASVDDEIELTYYYGLLDEIRIFNRILDQSEIDELSTNK